MAYQFLSNPTAKDIQVGNKLEAFDDTIFKGTDTVFGSLYQKKTIKAKVKGYKLLSYKQEDFITKLVFSSITENPDLLYRCSKDIKTSLRALKQYILDKKKIKVNMIEAYQFSEKNKKTLLSLMAFIKAGVLSVPDYKSRIVANNKVSKNDEILLLSSKHQSDGNFKRVGKFSGLYKGKPAIVAFSEKAINELSLVFKKDRLYNYYISAYEIKPEIISKQNDLDTGLSLNLMTATDIVEFLTQGLCTREQIKTKCSPEQIKQINSIIKHKFMC